MSGNKVRKVHIDGREWRYTLNRRGTPTVRIFDDQGTLLDEVAHHVLLGKPSSYDLEMERDDMHRGYVRTDDSLSITPALVKIYIETHLAGTPE